MLELRWVNNEFVAADTLALLLEHGGETDLCYDECMDMFIEHDWEVFFAALNCQNRTWFAVIVYLWMVMLGYGARYKKDQDFIEVFNEFDSDAVFDLEKLKNFRNYYFGITHIENDYAISIYDKATLWEVVRIKSQFFRIKSS